MLEADAIAGELEGVPPSSPLVLDPSSASSEEFIQLCAIDDELFCRSFFPDIFTQEDPTFAQEVSFALNDRRQRYVGIKMFRGSGKTTRLRAFAMKRIAYGDSRLIVIVCRAQNPNAIASLAWIKKQIETNDLLCNTFGLTKGDKWTEDIIEIRHRTLGHTIFVKAVGIEGNIRGYNFDGKRPDLFICDDLCDDENAKNPEQRAKMRSLFFGALDKSLVPETDNPAAKMVFLQTPIDSEDLICLCEKDPSWTVITVGCFDEDGNSTWEARFPTATLQLKKQTHINRGDLRIWLAEMECRLIGGEDSAFEDRWLKFWHVVPERRVVVIAIDPVPPPSEQAVAKGLHNKDFEVISANAVTPEGYMVLDIERMRGHEPDWTLQKFFMLVDKWNPMCVVVEAVNYQRTLKYILEQEMNKRRRWIQIKTEDSKRKKIHRITQAIKPIASNGKFFVHPSMTELISQFGTYPHVKHDDDIDSVSMGMEECQRLDFSLGMENLGAIHEMAPIGDEWRIAP